MPHRIGDLVFDYQNSPSPLPSPARGEGVYILEIANEGSAPEEDLRMQAGFPNGVNFSHFGKVPDLRIYQPEEIKLDDESFFVAFKNFPKNALEGKAFEKAKRAGGTKIGGVNLVVLSVTTLQQMIDNKTLTKEEAQRMLDEAKIGAKSKSGI